LDLRWTILPGSLLGNKAFIKTIASNLWMIWSLRYWLTREEIKVTIETELKKISKSLSLINDSQTSNKISSTNLENIDDILNDYLPLHLKWIEKGNSWIVESLSENRQLDRQAFSQLLVGVRNLYLDLEELQDLLIEVSNEIDEN
jgi:hypothetical protein